jgi:hypothetical protein
MDQVTSFSSVNPKQSVLYCGQMVAGITARRGAPSPPSCPALLIGLAAATGGIQPVAGLHGLANGAKETAPAIREAGAASVREECRMREPTRSGYRFSDLRVPLNSALRAEMSPSEDLAMSRA